MFNNYNGKYLIVNNKYVGKVISELWSNNCALLKLENYVDHVDMILKNNKELRGIEQSIMDDNKGYLIATNNMKVEQIESGESIKKALNLMKDIKLNELIREINTKFDGFMSKIRVEKTDINKLVSNKIREFEENKENKHTKIITDMMQRLSNSKQILYSTQYNGGENMEDAAPDSVYEIKEILLKNLVEESNFDVNYYCELNKSLAYRYPIEDNKDTISYGKELIDIITDHLHTFNLNININGKMITKEGEDTNLFEQYSLFNFLKFEIVDGYVEITDIKKEDRVITEELIPNLMYLKEQQYEREIDYERLLSLLLSVNEYNIVENNDLVKEILKVMSQEYIIAMQPKINALIWTIIRLISCWYADNELRNKIHKIRILINTFRSRSDEQYNKINGVKPLISIYPEYGKKNAYNVLAYLSLYFFKFKEFGNGRDIPTFYKNIDNDSLLYYTNSSTDMKEYVKYLRENNLSGEIFDSKLISINNNENRIEQQLVEPKSTDITTETKISELVEEVEPESTEVVLETKISKLVKEEPTPSDILT